MFTSWRNICNILYKKSNNNGISAGHHKITPNDSVFIILHYEQDHPVLVINHCEASWRVHLDFNF